MAAAAAQASSQIFISYRREDSIAHVNALFTMPAADKLPPDLEPLARRNAFEMRDSRWEADAKLLIQALEDSGRIERAVQRSPNAAEAGSAPVATHDESRETSRRLLPVALALAAAVAIGVWLFWPSQHLAPTAAQSSPAAAPAPGPQTGAPPAPQKPQTDAAPPSPQRTASAQATPPASATPGQTAASPPQRVASAPTAGSIPGDAGQSSSLALEMQRQALLARTLDNLAKRPSPELLDAASHLKGSDDDAPVRVGREIPMPRKVKDVAPLYPPVAQSAHVQGVVIVDVTVDAAGHVTGTKILRSIPLLDAAALDAVRQWEFTPTMVSGKPIPVIFTATVNFALQ